MYEDRYIAFIDILGFGSLVEKSSIDANLPEQILSALQSIQPNVLHEKAYATINYELVPPDQLEQVERDLREMTSTIRGMHPVSITYFSDSLVVSAQAGDVVASQMILDMLSKLSIRLWDEHSLLIRGGITKGQLVHIEGGPIFGPAMNRAHELESTLAGTPRVLIDKECYEEYRQASNFALFESLFELDGEYRYASLGTAYRHIINDSSLGLAGETALSKYRISLESTPQKIAKIIEGLNDDCVKKKYEWLSTEIEQRTTEVKQP